MRVAIYSRATTKDDPAIADEQIRQMQALILRDDCEMIKVYRDLVTTPGANQPAYQQMLLDIKQRHFDVLVFWALEQLSHQNTSRTILLLDDLIQSGIRFCSYTEQHLDSCHALKDIVTSIITTLVKQDRIYISEQTRIGLEQQKKTQKRGPQGRLGPGRPIADFDQRKAEALRLKKKSYAAIASTCGVSKATIFRFFKNRDQEKGKGNAS